MKLMLSVVGLLCVIAMGCEQPAPEAGKKPRVVTTTTMIGDLVRQIAGDRVQLDVIMGAGVDPHTFKPSPADMMKLSQADLIFYNGLHLEGKMIELFEEKLKGKSVAVSRDIPEGQLLSWQEGEGGVHDPHIWLDVKLWWQAGQTVAKALQQLDAPHASDYVTAATKLETEMKALDEEVRQKLATVPKTQRALITSHDAYNYFGKAYDVEVKGLQGISTETEAGIANVNSAVDFIINRKIPAIFVESSVSPKTIERVQADCKSRGHTVAIGGELYSDAMGEAGQHPGYAVETYAGMIRYNVDTIVKALQPAK